MNEGAAESNGHQELGRGYGHIIQHSPQDRSSRSAGSCEQTRHREDAPHQHTGAVDAKCNSESGKRVHQIDGDNNVAEVLTKNVKVGVLDKRMAGTRFSREDTVQQGSQHSSEKQISAVSGGAERRTPDAAAAEGAASMARRGGGGPVPGGSTRRLVLNQPRGALKMRRRSRT